MFKLAGYGYKEVLVLVTEDDGEGVDILELGVVLTIKKKI